MSYTLFVTTYNPADDVNGGAAWIDKKIIADLRSRRDRVDIFLVCTGQPRGIPLHIGSDLTALFKTAIKMAQPGQPFTFAKFTHNALAWRERADALKLDALGFSEIVTSQTPALILAREAGVRVHQHIAHNVDAQIAKTYDPVPLRLLANARRTMNAERKVLQHARQIRCLSRLDGETIGGWHPHVNFIGRLVDVPDSDPDTERRRTFSIGFFGNASWRPNREGIATLVDYILPAVRRRFPDQEINLVLAGAGTDAWKGHVGVRALGKIELVETFYSQVDLSVVPRSEGASGISVKILESLEWRVPVLAPRSLAFAADVESVVLMADNNEEMVERIIKEVSRVQF